MQCESVLASVRLAIKRAINGGEAIACTALCIAWIMQTYILHSLMYAMHKSTPPYSDNAAVWPSQRVSIVSGLFKSNSGFGRILFALAFIIFVDVIAGELIVLQRKCVHRTLTVCGFRRRCNQRRTFSTHKTPHRHRMCHIVNGWHAVLARMCAFVCVINDRLSFDSLDIV